MEEMKKVPWDRFTQFGGLDWSRDHHDVVVVDPRGRVTMELRINDDAEGWSQLRKKLAELAGPDLAAIAVAIETNCGPAVERLLELGCTIYPLNPKAAQRYRDRKVPSGGRHDRLDAWSMADALRTDGHGWPPLQPENPTIQELRLLCRDEVHLIEQRTALVNQLRQALHEYYPAALEVFDDWTVPGPWRFIERFPTPQALLQAGKRQWEKFLHTHRLYRRTTYERRLAVFARAAAFCGPLPVTNAKSRLAVALAKQLCLLEGQLKAQHARILGLFKEHPDHTLFDSLPGLGEKLAPRLLGECGDHRSRFQDAEALQCYAGTAPVSFQSGPMHRVKLRRACNKRLRGVVHLWANLSRVKCPWAEIYYQQKRQEGKSHACALRCLGQRWLKILWKMWKTRTPYDEQTHTRNQLKNGSWVMTLMPAAKPEELSHPPRLSPARHRRD